MALPTIDSGFPKHAFSSAAPTSSSIASITTTGASLMVAVLHIDNPGANPTVTSAGGLTWTERVHESAVGTASHWVSVWTAPSAGALSAVTITFSFTSGGAAMLDIYSVSGAAASPIGASATLDSNASASAPQVTVNAQAANSLIIGGFDNFQGAGTLTALANTTKDQSDATVDELTSGHASTVAAGNITVGGSAPNVANSCCVALEILGVSAGGGTAVFYRPRNNFKPNPVSRFQSRPAYPSSGTSSVDLGGGNIAGVATLTADLALAEALAGAIAGQGTLTANLALAEALAGAIAGQATLTANLSLAEALAGAIAGQGTLTADLKEAIALAGNLAGAASLTADLKLAVALAGAIAGQATLSASLVEAIALSGNIAGIASLAASLALAEALAGNIAGQSTVTLDVQTGTPIAGNVAGAALVTADLRLAVALAGNIAGTSSITARLSLPSGAVTYTVFVFDD